MARSAPAGVCWKPGSLLNSPAMGVDRGVQALAVGGVGLDATSPSHVCTEQMQEAGPSLSQARSPKTSGRTFLPSSCFSSLR